MTQLTIYKLDEMGQEVWHYPAKVLQRGVTWIRLEAAFDRSLVDLGFTTLARGDRFIEYFYSDRWYNVFAVHEGQSDNLKGWYCNVCRPAQWDQAELRCEDLALDLWVDVDGSSLVLDQDEFEELALSSEERAACRTALKALLRMAELGTLPR